ncbi:retrotransposon protein, putative, ty1-copia subclass [Tanacetum coccineum]
MGYSFYYPPENKVFVARNAEFLENSLIAQEASGSLEDVEIIQEEDTHPSIDTSLNHEEDDQEIDEPQSDINLIRRSQGHTGPRIKCVLYINAKNMIRGSREPLTIKPHCDIRSIRILIAIAAFYDYEIWQMDVKTAFLNGYLNEEVYMEHQRVLLTKNFQTDQNRNELCVYVKASRSYDTFLILYVDDILIMGNNIPMLQDVKSYLGRCFAMKDLGEAAYILGIKIYRDRSKQLIGLCHSAYIEKILKRFYMENSKHETIPIQEKLKLSKSQGASTPAEIQRMQNIPYALVLGSIMYNRLGLGELVNDQLDNSKDEGVVAEARGAHDEEGGVRRRPNMTFTSRLRAMDDRLGDMDTNIYKLSNDVEDLTYVVSGMSEQYDQFYGEFGQMRMESICVNLKKIDMFFLLN